MPRRARLPEPPVAHRAVRYHVEGVSPAPAVHATAYDVVATVHERPRDAERDLEDRPAFLQAISAVVRERAGTLLVPAPHTLGADPVRRALAVALLRMHEAAIVFETDVEPGPITMSFQHLTDTLLAFERLARGARIRVGLDARRGEEKAPGGDAPYGFRRVEGKLVADDAEQLVMKRICDLRRGGATYQAISDALLADGIGPRRGGPWRPQTLSNIIERATRQA